MALSSIGRNLRKKICSFSTFFFCHKRQLLVHLVFQSRRLFLSRLHRRSSLYISRLYLRLFIVRSRDFWIPYGYPYSLCSLEKSWNCQLFLTLTNSHADALFSVTLMLAEIQIQAVSYTPANSFLSWPYEERWAISLRHYVRTSLTIERNHLRTESTVSYK